MNKTFSQQLAHKATTAAIAGALVTALASLPVTALAQETTAAVRGIVTDSAGAPVADAEVVVTNLGTGRSSTASSDTVFPTVGITVALR